MAAELQLVSAGLFLKYASEADYMAIELLERVEQLRHVTEGVNSVLQSRQKANVPLADKGDTLIEAKIKESLTACLEFLQDLEQWIGGFNSSDVPVKVLVDRFKVAFDQCQTHSTIGANHGELLELIAKLDEQVLHGNGLLKSILGRFGQDPTAILAVPPTQLTLMHDLQAETGAVSSLSDCLQVAEDIYEKYTSEYVPDDCSTRDQNGVIAPIRLLSSHGGQDKAELETAAPVSKTVNATPSLSGMSVNAVSHAGTHALPLRILNRYIVDHRDKASLEMKKSHFDQAETCLGSAALYSEAREHQYGIPFAEKIEIGEELVNIYQQQGRWFEAVSKVHELMRQDSQGIDDAAVLANTRHNQLLATVYFDRDMHSTSDTLHSGSDDLDDAEKHAHIAFAKRDAILERGDGAVSQGEETDRHYICMKLLVSILEARGKLM
ncbi:hypothetical protein LTR17_018071 [Elasticomyces elasticus]|nr:hypothetical protein LTR17_018071 [Elasticomyces elasticus]